MKQGLARMCLGVGLTLGACLTVRAQSPTNVNMIVTNNVTIDWLWATQYLVLATSAGNGSVSGHTNDWLDAGSNATVLANANPNYHFVRWTGVPSAVTNNNPAVFAVDSFYTNAAAYFALDVKTVTVSSPYGAALPGSTNVSYGTLLDESIAPLVITTMPGRVRVRVKDVRVSGNDCTTSP